MFTHFWIDFVTLFTMLNPIHVIPAYLALTGGLEPVSRRKILRRAILVAGAILLLFLILGEIVLSALGVTLNAFRIAGGLVILLIGLRMVFGDDERTEAVTENKSKSRDIAVFPLAMPLIAGSGAIMAIILLTENNLHDVPQQIGTGLTMCLVLALNYVALEAAGPIHRFLGSTGVAVVARVTGLVITAIAVQSIIVGLQNVFPGLQKGIGASVSSGRNEVEVHALPFASSIRATARVKPADAALIL